MRESCSNAVPRIQAPPFPGSLSNAELPNPDYVAGFLLRRITKREVTIAFTREWFDHPMEVIVKNPDILGGTPVFRGVSVQVLFEYLEGEETLEDFLEGFPTVSRESAVAALEEVKQLLLARS